MDSWVRKWPLQRSACLRLGLLLGLLLVAVGCLSAATAGPAGAKPPASFDPLVEAKNFAITLQRQAIYDTPSYQAKLSAISAANLTNALVTQASDPGRLFTSDLCWNQGNGCAGDIRLNDWGTAGYGLVRPVLFTARDGATLSGHVWATVAGPARRPAVVITNGSVQADEQMYWYAAQTLAKAGYVVLTFDPQGQGQSDTFGEGADSLEGVPAQTDGRPFYDGTEDALNFLLSSPQHPYQPVRSCTSGTSHDAKQNLRVRQGFDAAYNPYWQLINRQEIGLAGHSYGAAGVSYIAQWDPRVKAVVAWDNLGGPGPNAAPVPGSSGSSATIGEAGCPADPAARRAVPIAKPGLGISADYGLPPTPNGSLPNPLGKSTLSLAYSQVGVDSGEIVIRGGSHLDFSFIPNQAFGASLRGPDITDWYTTAWFDRYLKHDRTADARLLSDRWRHDPVEASVDPSHDGNGFSFYYYSRLAVHLSNGRAVDCEDLREGCSALVAADGYGGDYSYAAIDTTPDAVAGPGGPLSGSSGVCRAIRIRLRGAARRPVVKVKVYVDRRLVLTRRGRRLRALTLPGLPGSRSHTLRVITYTRSGRVHTRRWKVWGCAHRPRVHR
jgi:dienelactone hydrolase